MRTVKELSELTGISVRTLHYYDEIGLLTPTEKSDAGYRLYDEKALETLQQILFFREFEIPLKEIKALMEDATLEKNDILQMQRKMLLAKKERLEHLIADIDNILKGENAMDFTGFRQTELEELFQTMLEHLPEDLRRTSIQEFGSVEQWKQHYIEVLSSAKMQKVFEWYGGKENYLSAVKNPISKETAEHCNQKLNEILEKLNEKREMPADSPAIQALVGEYCAVMKELSRVEEEREWMLATANFYRNSPSGTRLDETYGAGIADFLANAIETFYR